MRRYFIVISTLIICVLQIDLSAQSNCADFDETNFKDRLLYGGGLGLSFGTATNIELSPQVIFRHTNRLNEGVGLIYKYFSARDWYSNRVSTSIYGGKAFVNYMITDQIFPHVEFEVLNLDSRYFDQLGIYQNTDRFWYQNLLVGAGYYMPMGSRSGAYMIALYNLNDSSNSPYATPWVFRMGFTF